MINNFLPTIGLEVHCALNTKSKMFSDAKNSHNDKPNTNISFFDLALPGVLPSINENAVKKALVLAKALNMQIDTLLRFDRKNYYYQDLPKGYQITQQYFPIGKNGYIEIADNKKIDIERIHMEEDTAKEQTINGHILLDYNRAGVPLIEIVSRPVIHSANEAVMYLTKLKQILVFMDISDGKMEDGSLRVDLNVSIAPHGLNQLGTKVEVKNLNSFANVAKAINHEIQRQSELLLKDLPVMQETRKWNDSLNQTEYMRSKADTIQYKYFREPNIIKLQLAKEFVNDALSHAHKHPKQIYQELKDLNLNQKIIDQLMNDYPLYKVFNDVLNYSKDVNLTLTWILVELVAYLKNKNTTCEAINNEQLSLIKKLLDLLIKEDINGKQAKVIFPLMLDELKEPSVLVKQKGFVQIKDEKTLSDLLNQIVDNNLNMLNQYASRGERVLKFYLGMLMKQTHGQANPVISNKILIKIIDEKLKKAK